MRKAIVDKHWEGLTLFLDEPWLPLNKNLAQRLLRPASVARLRARARIQAGLWPTAVSRRSVPLRWWSEHPNGFSASPWCPNATARADQGRPLR